MDQKEVKIKESKAQQICSVKGNLNFTIFYPLTESPDQPGYSKPFILSGVRWILILVVEFFLQEPSLCQILNIDHVGHVIQNTIPYINNKKVYYYK